jgi:hypothetical protein
LEDHHYQGYALQPVEHDPFRLLTEGSRLIRKLFIQSEGDQVALLPVLPPQFHSGRLLQAKVKNGTLDIEWTKKSLRRVFIHAAKEGTIDLQIPSQVKRYRVRQKLHEKGEIVTKGSSLDIQPGVTYLLDHFEN